MTPRLSLLTRQLVEITFRSPDATEAILWLKQDCGDNLPFCAGQNESEMERLRFAAIKLSKGNLHQLRKAIDLARIDWRDLLMAAGFGDDVDAHNEWAKEVLHTS